jgi:tetratricopeptide (TPR) repeat protein
VLVALSIQSWRQTRVWRDSEALWRHALAVTTPNCVSHGSLARFLWSKQRVAEAVPHFEAALTIQPENVEFHNTVALGLMQLGRPSEAIAHWRCALDVAPHNVQVQNNLAWVLATCSERSMRDGAQAVQLARDAIAARGAPTPDLLRTLAAAHSEAGEPARAVEIAREALELASANAEPHLAAELGAQLRDYESNSPVRGRTLPGLQPPNGEPDASDGLRLQSIANDL